DLSTAQDLVDSGILDSSALTANGGNLDPTDRVIDHYSQPHREKITTLSPTLAGTHTVRIEVTGYKNSASSGTRVYLTGVTTHEGDQVPLTTPGVQLVKVDEFSSSIAAQEYAMTLNPQGGVSEWYGNWHGQDVDTSFEILVDGSPVTLNNGDIVVPNDSLLIIRKSDGFNSGIDGGAASGATPIAKTTVNYEMKKGVGLDVSYEIEMLTSGTLGKSYSLMESASKTLDKGTTLGYGQDVVMLHYDNSHNAISRSNLAYLWEENGVKASMLYIPEIMETIGGEWYDDNLYLEDRKNDDLNKIYLTRGSVSYAPGHKFTAHGIYVGKVFPQGADSVLARVYPADEPGNDVPGVPNTGVFRLSNEATVSLFATIIAASLIGTILLVYKVLIKI
ncbi:MAG: hypothetical protein LBH36_01445, partial [Candidatus Nomurabacteria bacterium]|nr:hypothetical protein [Candidatus Nomurabacteria bacterium]